MADQQLYSITNLTKADAQLISVYYPQDDCKIPAGAVTHTGGTGGDYIRIPDCSGSEWYPDHHILVQANDGSWTISFWSNDQQEGLLFWSPADVYSEQNPLEGSDDDWHSALTIQISEGKVSVTWQPGQLGTTSDSPEMQERRP